ncbi:MAG: DUF58 domain-containing protein [Pseudomonadota bacterium]
MPLATLRAEADNLARQLPAALLSADAADIVHPGAAGRRRAGSGEDFWQYRRYAQTDAADQIDWRRSARGDEYFVRETELETARSVLFWADPLAGFDWSGHGDRKTKAAHAKIIMLALATLLGKAGERIGILGGHRGPSVGKSAASRLGEDLLARPTRELSAPKTRAIAVLASDFYEGVETWTARIARLTTTCDRGVLFVVTDPVEHEFPFQGRTRLHLPGTATSRLLGRAEAARDIYLSKLDDHARDLDQLTGQTGWAVVRWRTDMPPLRGAAALLRAVEQFGARTT